MSVISQPQLFSAILLHLDEQGVKEMNPRQMNAVIAAANCIVAELDRENVGAKPLMGLRGWLASDDTGLSSLFLAHALAPLAGLGYVHCDRPADRDYPRDGGDFGRCVRLLDAVPELRPHLSRMAEHGPVWAAIAAGWDTLEAWYREDLPTGRSDRLFDRLGVIGREVRS